VKRQFSLGETGDASKSNIPKTGQTPESIRALRELRVCQNISNRLANGTEKRKYFLLRAWAIARGIIDIKSPESLVKQISFESAIDSHTMDLNAIARDLLRRNPAGKNEELEGLEHSNLVSILDRLEKTTMHQRINGEHYLVIKIVSDAADTTVLGRILFSIDGKLQELNNMLTAAMDNQTHPMLW
jgi:hypothetical protein